jgi:hypothetical protein
MGENGKPSESALSGAAVLSFALTVFSGMALWMTCYGMNQGGLVFPAIGTFIIAVILDFFAGRAWIAVLARVLQVMVAIGFLLALNWVLRGIDH